MDGEIINNPAQIAQVLRKVQDARSFLVITIPGENIPYQSAILEINLQDGYLLLDEITPIRGHKKFLETKKLIANTKIKGVDIRFTAELDEQLIDANIALYRMKFPNQLIYMQKRQSYRISLGITTKLPITVQRENGAIIQGRVLNISETGVGAALETPVKLEMSEVLPTCELILPGDEVVTSKLEIRFIKRDKTDSPLRIGGRFIDLPGIEQRQLARVILDLQRDMMRRLPKDSL